MLTRAKCKYYQTCTIYQGLESTGHMSLMIYKNVFCNRGEKGWLGCEKHMYLNKCQE
jgi:hypothetical protein